MGTYARTNFPNSYRLRERSWVYDASGNPAGSADFTGTATVAQNGNSWSGSGTLTQYDPSGGVVFTVADFTYTATRFLPDSPPAATPAGIAAVADPRGMGVRGRLQVAQ
jgi:hypothetical protein